MSGRLHAARAQVAATVLGIVAAGLLTVSAPLSASAFIPPPGPTGVVTCPYSANPFAAHLRMLHFSPVAAHWATELTITSCF